MTNSNVMEINDFKKDCENATSQIGRGFLNRSVAYKKMGEIELANNDFETAKEYLSTKELYSCMASISYVDLNHEEALGWYNKLLELDNLNTSALDGRARTYCELSMFEEAIKDYEVILSTFTGDISRDSQYVSTSLQLAKVYVELSNYDRALSICNDVYESSKILNYEIDALKCGYEISKKMGDDKKTVEYAEELYDIYKSCYDTDYPSENDIYANEELFTKSDFDDVKATIDSLCK